jgi:hypothetical protein
MYKLVTVVHSSQAFKHIFTSPTSVSPDEFGPDDEDENELNNNSDNESESLSKRQRLMDVANGRGRTCSHMAALLGMKAVQPRVIAYIAVQVRDTSHYFTIFSDIF